MEYDWDESEDFDDAAETEEKEEQEEVEHDLDYWAEEAETSDAIAEDERITAELEDAFIAVVESELEKEDDPAGYDDDVSEDEHDASAPISFSTLRQETAEVAVDRTSKAARTEKDFKIVIGEMDRLDKNRRRRERYHEVLRGDVPLEYKTTHDRLIFPLYLSDPKQRLLFHGQFWDILCDCPYEMHELTGNIFLSKMVKDLKMDHKELLY
ncbi:MAG: sigma-70 family RNA polymerase sigma factor, partial [Anaerotignum sp.]|nr:sigma-70 family RNA polymerase sigma factor [Anaerotignum sp.]